MLKNKKQQLLNENKSRGNLSDKKNIKDSIRFRYVR